jgi:hypothetical protein
MHEGAQEALTVADYRSDARFIGRLFHLYWVLET